MSPHKRHLRDHVATPGEWRQCARKRRYPDRGQAMKGGRASMHYEPDTPLWVYRCKLCKGWHLTKRQGDPKDSVLC